MLLCDLQGKQTPCVLLSLETANFKPPQATKPVTQSGIKPLRCKK